MVHFPIEFSVEVDKGTLAPIEIRAGRQRVLAAGPPPELGGSDVWWSPEQLLVSAVASCFTATLFSMAEKTALRIGSYRCRARGVLDRTGAAIAFVSMHLALDIRVLGGDEDRAKKLVASAQERCFVANTLRCPVDVSVVLTDS